MHFEILIDPSETENKCTIARLSKRSDFSFFPLKGPGPIGPLHSQILLHHDGECLMTIRKSLRVITRMATIDCVWRKLDSALRRLATPLPLLARIPEGFETAYPRRSKYTTDPSAGLATIEAVFTASALLGNWDTSLLSEYYFGSAFVEKNKTRFLELGVEEAAFPEAYPILSHRPRNALQRKHDRGMRIFR